jgi:hypothetical protein
MGEACRGSFEPRLPGNYIQEGSMSISMWVVGLALSAAVVTTYELQGASAEQTWNGIVSDSSCKEDHGGEVDPKECTAKCVRGSDQYVLMVDGYTRAMPIANQDFPDLPAHAGDTVKATGELRDGAIFLTKLQ